MIYSTKSKIPSHVLSEHIYTSIQNEKILTNRNREYIQTFLKKNCIYMAFDANNTTKPIGFIFSHEITNGIVELQSLWVDPLCRKRGIAKRLIADATQNRQKKYVTALVQPFLSSVFLEQGFKKVDIYITPLGILLRYLLRKSLFDILNFSRKSESALYIKI
ncbi:MAG: GNAT family N-acetyltransferase [Patescibacteria group bacterium]